MLLAQAVDPSDIQNILTRNDYTVAGILVGAIIVSGLALWRVCSWVGKEFLIPSRDRAFRHLDTVDSTMREISGSLQKLSEVPGRLDRIEHKVDDLSVRVDGLDEHMKLQDAKLSTRHE